MRFGRKKSGGGLRSKISNSKFGQKRKLKKAYKKKKVANKYARKTARSDGRTEGVFQRVQGRLNRTKAKQEGKLSKTYGKFNKEESEALAEMEPLNDAMVAELEENEIPVENPDDIVEVATKYAQTNPDIENPMDNEDYDDAFVKGVEDFESLEHAEKARTKGRLFAKAALTAVSSGLQTYFKDLQAKEREGTISDKEQQILDAKKDAVRGGVQSVVKDKLFDFAPLLVIGAIILLFAKK